MPRLCVPTKAKASKLGTLRSLSRLKSEVGLKSDIIIFSLFEK